MKQSDGQRARRLLRIREEKATFRWNYFLRSPRFWMAATAVVGMLSYTLAGELSLVVNRATWLIAGVFIGGRLRDYIWLEDVVDAAPFLDKVLDWGKVEELASRSEAP